MKDRFINNPFQGLNLTSADRILLEDVANECIATNFELYINFTAHAKRKINANRWKLLKGGEKTQVYIERLKGLTATAGRIPTGSRLPTLMSVGTIEGKLDDLMFGLVSENLETMRVKASYVGGISGAAVLDSVLLPTKEKPFQSLVIKWMELDVPFRSTTLVKNHDYVCLEGTGYFHDAQGERVGYHLLHSINFKQTHQLPSRVRGNLSVAGFWRQIGGNIMEMYATGVIDPVESGMVRKLVVPSLTNFFVSTLKYPFCGQMRKLAYMLDKKYAESKMRERQNRSRVCVTCSVPVSSHRHGDFSMSNSSCKLCFGFVCHTCKVTRKLSFIDPSLQLSRHKVTFCTTCISRVTCMSAMDVARAQIVAAQKHQRSK